MKTIWKFLLSLAVTFLVTTSHAADKRIILIAGKKSHGPGDHEFRAGCLLLQKCLNKFPGIASEVHSNGWLASDAVFDGANAVLIYADGGGGHPALQGNHREVLGRLVQKGAGLGCAHYGVEVPTTNGPLFLEWIGGYYESGYSVNPMWTPEFKSFPTHPVTRGVKPFALLDEWYFNMRWRPVSKGLDASLDGASLALPPKTLLPILVAKPSDAVRDGPYVAPRGPYKHIQDAKGRDETMMWVYERPDGGRGFGFTGGHKHVNWANDNFRKVVLNGLLWIAKAEVPPEGAASTVAAEELAQNLDPKGVPADAPDLTGKWNFEVETPQGTGKPIFSFIHAGQNIIGHYQGRLGEADLSGSVKGNDAQWTFEVEFSGESVTVNYKGKIEGKDTMKGTVKLGEFEGTWTAKRE